MDEVEEKWLPVPGSEFHRVSDRGRVQSRRALNGDLLPDGEWRSCRLSRHSKGYLTVSINGSLRFVQDLVLTAFDRHRRPGEQACHFPDQDKANNRLSNLRWDSGSGNQRDTVRAGRLNTQVLSEDEAWGIRLLLTLGNGGPQIREVYPRANTRMVSNIKLGKSWSWLES